MSACRPERSLSSLGLATGPWKPEVTRSHQAFDMQPPLVILEKVHLFVQRRAHSEMKPAAKMQERRLRHDRSQRFG